MKRLPSLKQQRIVSINNDLAALRSNLSVFEKSGLRKSGQAKELVRKINEKVCERDEIQDGCPRRDGNEYGDN